MAEDEVYVHWMKPILNHTPNTRKQIEPKIVSPLTNLCLEHTIRLLDPKMAQLLKCKLHKILMLLWLKYNRVQVHK